MKSDEAYHRFNDPACLTPYERKIHDLRESGMETKEIALELGAKPETIRNYLRRIREKIVLQEITDAQSRRISWG